MAKTFTGTEASSLSRHGWTVNAYRTVATREYRGGVVSHIDASGAWWVRSATVRLAGTDDGAILAAMEANNRAWETPEYLAAAWRSVEA